MRARPAPGRLLLAAAALTTTPLLTAPLSAQYRDHAALTGAMRQVAARVGGRGELVTIATSPGGRVVQALRIGAAGRPSLLVVANAHGPHLIGSAVALAAAEQMASRTDGPTVWFIPRLNPDAAEAMLGALKWERTANGSAWDADRDQATDEDGLDDLDGNGAITQMRLADPNGAWMPDAQDPRLLRRADAAKGEVGRFTILTEGRDDDGDLRYNEDGPGGTDVNQNFSYGYPHHGSEAGNFPFESPEAKGLADFVTAHPEIAAIYVLGPQDNLMKPWENRPNAGILNPQTNVRAMEGTSAGGPLNSIVRGDQATFADVGARFQKTTGLSKGPSSAGLTGDVLSWSYFHFGRWAFGSRAWWVPDAPKDTTRGARAATSGGSDPLADERNALKWFESQGIDAFVPWTSVTLAGERRAAEVGGFRPGALLNPPAGAELDSTLARQSRFIGELAGMLPAIALRDVVVTALGEGVFRVEADVANTGALPTTTDLASRLRMPRRIKVELGLGSATLLSGEKIQLVGPIDGGGRSTRLAWTVAARPGATLQLSAESPVTGSATQTITLR
ncbi:MAG TPA: M14 family zinc carboxypeptidase [Gemmatimonadales bacterium]|nr:M14 family zinc carboxypeptidase [Gemmatimonadales bacterium]